jgi:hypothetical protein
MPAADLFLNAASPPPERSFAKEQAFVMAAVLDEMGSVFPGFEAEICAIVDYQSHLSSPYKVRH